MSDVNALPPAVRAYVHGFFVRGRRLAVVRGAGLAVALFVTWMLLWCCVDRFTQLPSWVRLGLLGAGTVAGAALLARPLRQLLSRRTDWVDIASRIEAQNPRFDQRLVTVTSRLLGSPDYRGSDEILEHLVYEVDRQAAAENASLLLPLRPAIIPWLAVVATVITTAALARVPDLNLPRLAGRFVAPLAGIPPVTTTRLAVIPSGDRDVPQGSALQIDVDADRLDGAPVWAHLSDDGGKTWSHVVMNGAGDGRFAHTLASVDRDLRYYVTGGDAQTRHFNVRVLRPPGVAEFRVRYLFPASTGKPPLTVTNADGVIEAPAGTDAIVTITATEPLQSALLTVAGEKVLMTRAGADTMRQGRITVLKDGRYDLDLISTREQTGSGPSTMVIRALPDRPPLIRMAGMGDNLRLNPRDILPVAFEALDDYGLESIAVRAQAGTSAAVEVPVETFGDARSEGPPVPEVTALGSARAESGGGLPRRREGVFHLDLATMPLAVGDVLTITLAARDSANNPAFSEPLHVLISPRSVDVETYERIGELEAASQLATTLVEELEAATKALEEAEQQGQSQASLVSVGRMNRRVTSGSEVAATVRRSLLRATARGSSPELAVALAGWVDSAQVQSWAAQALFRFGATTPAQRGAAADVLRRLLQSARDLEVDLRTVAQGERALALMADRENLAATVKRPPPTDLKAAEVYRRTLQRAREDIAAGVTRIGLKPEAGDLDRQLKAKAEAGRMVVASRRPVDFAEAAREWSQEWVQRLRRERKDRSDSRMVSRPGALEDRLTAAAQAEAVRPAADLGRARDLQLAARAATVISSRAAEAITAGRRDSAAADPAPFNEFVQAIAALQREHDAHRKLLEREDAVSPPDLDRVRAGAADARLVLARLVGDADTLADTAPGSRPSTGPASSPLTIAAAATSSKAARADWLALQAGAETAARNYDKANELDGSLHRQLISLGPAGASAAATSPANTEAGGASSASQAAQQQQVAALERARLNIQKFVAAAKNIDATTGAQQKLAAETKNAAASSGTADAAELAAPLASRQRDVAERIAAVSQQANPVGGAGTVSLAAGAPGPSSADDPNGRERANAAIVAAQAQLAGMPQQLAALQEAAVAWREAGRRADAAARDAASAGPDRKAAADRMAAQAAQDAQEAAGRFQAAAVPVAAPVADGLAAALDPFAPEASAAREVIVHQLAPALKVLRDAGQAGDEAAAARAATESRYAIETAQRELSRAQDAFAERDPLVSAKWFARAAADALSRKPPNFSGAERYQERTATALARAWDLSVQRAAAQRLSILPSFRPVLSAQPADPRGIDGARIPGPTARDWRRLRPREAEDSGALMRDAAPAEYEAALKMYFEALNKARDGGGK